MKFMINEPDIVAGEQPLHRALVEESKRILSETGVRFVLIEKFGLDIAVFCGGSNPRVKFVEAKVFTGQRAGGCPLGTSTGSGPQVDLLMHGDDDLAIVRNVVCWVIGDGLKSLGTRRFTLLDSVRIKATVMGGVARGKNNNLLMSALKGDWRTWVDTCESLRRFLVTR